MMPKKILQFGETLEIAFVGPKVAVAAPDLDFAAKH